MTVPGAKEGVQNPLLYPKKLTQCRHWASEKIIEQRCLFAIDFIKRDDIEENGVERIAKTVLRVTFIVLATLFFFFVM